MGGPWSSGNSSGEVQNQGLEIFRPASLQAIDTFAHFQGIPSAAAVGFRHRIEQGFDRYPPEGSGIDQGLREGFGFGPRAHEGPAAEFHIEHEAVQAFSQFFAHDAGGDEGNAGHGPGDIPQSIEFAVGRAEARGLAGHESAEGLNLPHHFLTAQADPESRDAFQLVEGAPGDSETATGDHGDPQAIDGQQRGQHQGGFVADAAGGVFVHHRRTFVRRAEVQHIAAVTHRTGQSPLFLRRHVLEKDRHGQGAQLVIRDGTIRQAGDEEFDLGRGQDAAIAFAGNQGRDVHSGRIW